MRPNALPPRRRQLGRRCFCFACAVLSLALLLLATDRPPAWAETPAERLHEILAGSAPTSVDELRSMQTRTREINKKITATVVGVRVGAAAGSGVVVSEDGFVLTAGHVSGRPGQSVTLILHDGSTVRAVSLGANYGVDSGLMKIVVDERQPARKWTFAAMGRSKDLKPGQWVLATGHPGGFQNGRSAPLRLGRVLARNTQYIVTDCPLIGGDSGGPLFDMAGEVIGVNSRIGDSLQTNIHVPVDLYHNTWDRLVASETWGGPRGPDSPYIGVASDGESDEAKVREVVPDSPAAKAGIQTGDVITKFDGREIADFQMLIDVVSGKKPGDKATIEIRRDGHPLKLELTVGKFGD